MSLLKTLLWSASVMPYCMAWRNKKQRQIDVASTFSLSLKIISTACNVVIYNYLTIFNYLNFYSPMTKYSLKIFRGGETRYETRYELIVRDDKIIIPTNLQRRVVEWYHEYVCHSGETCTEQTIWQLYVGKSTHDSAWIMMYDMSHLPIVKERQ
jgi:hypothetical protein